MIIINDFEKHGHVKTMMYVKPTSTGVLLHYHSHIDNQYKRSLLRANPCKNRPKSAIRGKAQKIKIALLLPSGRPK